MDQTNGIGCTSSHTKIWIRRVVGVPINQHELSLLNHILDRAAIEGIGELKVQASRAKLGPPEGSRTRDQLTEGR